MVCFSLSEMKLLDILSSLMMDDTYKGRGKYHSKVRHFHPHTWASDWTPEISERFLRWFSAALRLF